MKLLITTKTVDEADQLLGFFTEWIKLFSRKFEKITVFCLEKGKFDLPANVSVISLGKHNGLGKLKTLSALYALSFRLRHDYDAVFVHMNPIWMISGGILWKLLRKRKFLWYTTKGVTLKLRLAEKFTDKIFTASPESFRLNSKKVIVTGHGIDTELFKPDISHEIQDTRYRLLSVGRIAPVKNYETLVDAAGILKEKGIKFSITMIGEPALDSDKEYEANLESKIKSLKLTDDFKFIGKVDHRDLPRYYQSHDIFVHLSKTGSLDKTILEAMACGMTVLSSNDASRNFLSPELLFNENDPLQLAEKIILVQGRKLDFRQYVVQNHNLDRLIERISKEIIK